MGFLRFNGQICRFWRLFCQIDTGVINWHVARPWLVADGQVYKQSQARPGDQEMEGDTELILVYTEHVFSVTFRLICFMTSYFFNSNSVIRMYRVITAIKWWKNFYKHHANVGAIYNFLFSFIYLEFTYLWILDTWTCNRECLVIILIVWHLSDCTDQCLDTTHVFCPIMGDITSSRYNTWSSLYPRLMGGWMEKCCAETW